MGLPDPGAQTVQTYRPTFWRTAIRPDMACMPTSPTYTRIIYNTELMLNLVQGWNTTTLSRVVKECTITDIDLPANEGCPILNEQWEPNQADDCYLDPGNLVPAEHLGWDAPLDALPGCNLPWGATGPKPTCPGFQDPEFVPFSRFVHRQFVTAARSDHTRSDTSV